MLSCSKARARAEWPASSKWLYECSASMRMDGETFPQLGVIMRLDRTCWCSRPIFKANGTKGGSVNAIKTRGPDGVSRDSFSVS